MPISTANSWRSKSPYPIIAIGSKWLKGNPTTLLQKGAPRSAPFLYAFATHHPAIARVSTLLYKHIPTPILQLIGHTHCAKDGIKGLFDGFKAAMVHAC